MSRDMDRRGYYRDNRDRDHHRDRRRDHHEILDRRNDYRNYEKRSYRSPRREELRSRSPRVDKSDVLDENILSEISKLPEPSELWDSNQFQENFPPPASAPTGFNEPPSTYHSNYQPSYSGLYDDFPPVQSAPQPPEWNQMSLPPAPAPVPSQAAPSTSFLPPTNMDEHVKKEAAIESEMRHQKAALSKQREDYIKKTAVLKKELETLKDQRNELRGDPKRSPSPDTKRFLKENTKLQLEIQNKLKTIGNVVDMLNGIIGEEAQEVQLESDESPPASKRKSRSPSKSKLNTSREKYNYVYYDPEMHWCRVCNEFPPTAKDYLNHLHSAAHHKMAAAHMEAPWHSVTGMNEGFPSYPNAPNKRTPIKGLQFFVPSTAWYCKLCDQFIGDLHCASAHLKSITHSKNYMNFVEQNPHWETDWMSDRQKAVEKSRTKVKVEEKPAPPPVEKYTAHTITFNKDGIHTKVKEVPAPAVVKKEKKRKSKKKRDSSSSSASSSSGEERRKKKMKKEKSKAEDERMIAEWMSSVKTELLSAGERRLLNTLKERLRSPDGEKNNERHATDQQLISKLRETENHRSSRDSERRDSERRDAERRESDRRDSNRRRSPQRRRSSERRERSPKEDNKAGVKKMPFIGKMPVYKSLNKAKEDIKKEETKKEDEDEAAKKRREEMDAEIQKKVAEFKEKIAKAQLERAQQQPKNLPIPPPVLLAPNDVPRINPGSQINSVNVTPMPSAAPVIPNLQKDFQEALDIIFPDANKPDKIQQDILSNIANMAGLTGYPLNMMPPGFPPMMPNMPQMTNMPNMQNMPQMANMPNMQNMPQMMMGFDLYQQHRPQLYDNHVPIVPNNQRAQNRNQKPKNNPPKKQGNQPKKQNNQNNQKQNANNRKVDSATEVQKKEVMDDLAMLGIDASDVGAGI